MVFDRVRRIGRVFAVALLVWTAVDILDYGACANHQHLFPSYAPASVNAAAPATPDAPMGAPSGHSGDCFCCSPYVEVQTPFEVTLSYTVAWTLAPETVVHAVLSTSRLYHPPLA